MAGRSIGLALIASALAAGPAAAVEDEPGYAWTSELYEGIASLIYGSPEAGDDALFWLICNNPDKKTQMTVYVDIPGSKVGDKVAIELAASEAKTAVDGQIVTDEMSGFFFAEANDFKIKPVIELFKAAGPVTAKTGSVETPLPEKGRDDAIAKFAEGCTLD